MKILAINSFLSIPAGVLLVSSATTLKSVIPLRPLTSLKTGSIIFTNSALVNSSLNSKSTCSAALDIALSSIKNSLLTLILSNADALLSPVLSPNSITPAPGIFAIGFTLFLYSVSLCPFVGVHAKDVIPKYYLFSSQHVRTKQLYLNQLPP